MSTELLLNSKIASAAFNASKARAHALALIQATGEEWSKQEAIRYSFMVGYLAQRLAPTANAPSSKLFTQAELVLNMKGATSKSEDIKRSEDQERAYNAARQAWFGLLRDAGVKSAEGRGGKRVARTPDTKASTETKAPVAPRQSIAAAPIVTTASDAYSFLREEASRLTHFQKRNAKTLDASARDAIAAFLEAVSKLPKSE